MSISGRELIARIQGLIAQQARIEEREISGTMAASVNSELRIHGAEQHADEVFDLFRRARRDGFSMRSRIRENGEIQAGGNLAFERALQTVSLEMSSWGNLDPEYITKFYLEFHEAFEDLQSAFNKSRSRRSHLTAVFRPFKDRNVSTWDRYLDNYPTNEVRLEAAKLEDEVVTSETLDDWLDRVFRLFVTAGVYRAEMNQKHIVGDGTSNRMPIQIGMINQNSLEIYRGRWNEWRTFNRNEIEALLSPSEFNRWPVLESRTIRRNFVAPNDSYKGLGAENFARGSEITKSSVSVVISILENETINAKRSWVSNDSAASEIGSWLTMLQTLWGKVGDSVTARITFKSSAGDSEVTVPPSTFGEASMLLAQLIKNYS